jgi:hypothetical protein
LSQPPVQNFSVSSMSTDNCQLRNSQSNSLLQPLPQETPSIIISAGLGSSLYSLGADPTENTVNIVIAQRYFYCYFRIRCSWNVFIEPLPSNERLLWLYHSGFQASCHNKFGSMLE